jgi:hypothetical protein
MRIPHVNLCRLQNDQLNQDMIKAMDQHNRQCEELNIKLGNLLDYSP